MQVMAEVGLLALADPKPMGHSPAFGSQAVASVAPSAAAGPNPKGHLSCGTAVNTPFSDAAAAIATGVTGRVVLPFIIVVAPLTGHLGND